MEYVIEKLTYQNWVLTTSYVSSHTVHFECSCTTVHIVIKRLMKTLAVTLYAAPREESYGELERARAGNRRGDMYTKNSSLSDSSRNFVVLIINLDHLRFF